MEVKDKNYFEKYQLKNFAYLKTPEDWAKEKTFSFSKDKLR